MGRPSKWDGRLDLIAELAADGVPDRVIGERWGVSAHVVCAVRARYGIPTNSVRGGAGKLAAAPDAPPPARRIETVTVAGVTYCSPGWGSGATSDHRVKPRRR